MGKRAIILGATGFTGNLLVSKLLKDPRYDLILLFSRRSFGIKDSKLKEIILDPFELENSKKEFLADVVFCCIGTTKSKTPNKTKYKRIDKEIPITAAKIAKTNDISNFIIISALGANPKSRLFYNRVKGEMEVGIKSIGLKKLHILQPSLIKGQRNEKRIGEKIAGTVMDFLTPIMVGDLKKYQPITAEEIVDCMIWLDNNPCNKIEIPSDMIADIAGKE